MVSALTIIDDDTLDFAVDGFVNELGIDAGVAVLYHVQRCASSWRMSRVKVDALPIPVQHTSTSPTCSLAIVNPREA